VLPLLTSKGIHMFPCLLLTPWMTPHAVIQWEKAICMQYTGEIEVLETYDEEARSPSISIKFPAVARLIKKLPTQRHNVKFGRTAVYSRDSYSCQYCGTKLPGKQLTYDHVVPRSKGGRTTFENVASACKNCNSKKADKSLKQAGMQLKTKPVKPKSLPMTQHRIKLPDMVPTLWLPYLNR
jgi:5-methylcytosine-specific restriction endonuclease McrA